MNSRITWYSDKQYTESTDYVNLGPIRNNSRTSGCPDNEGANVSQKTPYNRTLSSIKPNLPAQKFFSPSSSLFHEDSERVSVKPSVSRQIEPDLNATTSRLHGFAMRTDENAASSAFATESEATKKWKPRRAEQREPADYKRILIGSVDHVIRWHKVARSADLNFLYEAVGTLDNWKAKGSAQLLFLRGELGQIIQGLFYSIDHALPPFRAGATYSIVGKMIGSHKMMVFNAQELKQEEKEAVQRLSFLCQRLLHMATGNPTD